MKSLLLLISLLVHCVCYSQPQPDYPIICFNCGKASAVKTDNVITIEDLVKNKNWYVLKIYMSSPDPTLMYLAVKVCEYAARKGELTFDAKDQTAIVTAKKSEEHIGYRYGCTFYEVYTLKKLFSKDTLKLNRRTKDWFNDIIK